MHIPPEEWGPFFWNTIHLVALGYPSEPTYVDKKAAKDFFESLVSYITSAPIVAMIIEGTGCVEKAREIIGKTSPQEAEEGTIRKIYAISKDKNSVHASDSKYSALREVNCIFNEEANQVA